MLVAYADSLFAVERFRQYKVMAQEVLEASIKGNVEQFSGQDIFRNTLYQKAAAHFRLLEYGQADYTLRELLRIHPQDRMAISLLRRCLYRCHPKFLRRARAAAVLLFLLAAIVTATEVLAVRPFWTSWVATFEWIRNGLFAVGILSLVLSEFWHRLRIDHELSGFKEHLQKRKHDKRFRM